MKKSMRPHLEKCDLALLKENSYIFYLFLQTFFGSDAQSAFPLKCFKIHPWVFPRFAAKHNQPDNRKEIPLLYWWRNTLSSAPHARFIRPPDTIQNLATDYFQDIPICFTEQNWLEIGS